MEFYYSEATILAEAKWRSILLPTIHKPILPYTIGHYLLYNLCQMFMVEAQLVYGYIIC